jgi:hypothetical protein
MVSCGLRLSVSALTKTLHHSRCIFFPSGERGAKGDPGTPGVGLRGEMGPPGIPGMKDQGLSLGEHQPWRQGHTVVPSLVGREEDLGHSKEKKRTSCLMEYFSSPMRHTF